MVSPARFELATFWFEAKHSNPLSYGDVVHASITDLILHDEKDNASGANSRCDKFSHNVFALTTH